MISLDDPSDQPSFYQREPKPRTTVTVYYEGQKVDSYSIAKKPQEALEQVYNDRSRRAQLCALWSGTWQIVVGTGKNKLIKDLVVD